MKQSKQPKELKKRIRKYKIARNAIIIGPENLGLLKSIAKLTSLFFIFKNTTDFLNQGLDGYEVLTGKPNQVALPLAYIGINQIPNKTNTLTQLLMAVVYSGSLHYFHVRQGSAGILQWR